MTPLFVDTAALLEAHELHPHYSKAAGANVWRCRTCELDVPSSERHSPAQAAHQAAILSGVEPSEQLPIGPENREREL